MRGRLRQWGVLIVLALAAWASWAAEPLNLGIFAFRPKPVMAHRYQPLGDYLSAELGRPVRVVFLDQAEMEAALARNQLDLVFTNPSHYLLLRSHNNLSGALATAISIEDGLPTHSLGGVIITRAGRSDIARLIDLKGRVIGVPGRQFLGGYQAQAFELFEAGVRLPDDARVREIGGHDAVVEAVLAGQVEVGFVRTGVLESLARAGRLDPGQIKVIHPQRLSGFPYAVSTRLYPEWPFIALPHVDQATVRRLVRALLSLEPDHPAARAAGLAGFAPPADYQPVENVARTLRLPPFDTPPRLHWRDLWQQYGAWLGALGVALVLLSGTVIGLFRQNRRITAARLALAEAEARYRRVVEHSPSIVFELDAQGRVRYVSPRWTAVLGRRAEDVLGLPWCDVVLPEDAPACAHVLAECLVHRRTVEGAELRLQHRDGSVRWLRVGLAPHVDAAGQVLGVSGDAQDITERWQSEERLRIAASVFTYAGEGILVTDLDGVILDVNEAFTRITGYTRQEVLGRNPKLLQSGRQGPEFYAALWQALLERGHWAGEIWNRRKNGEVYAEWLDISAVRDASGRATHYVAIFSDISQLKAQQRQLERIAHYDALTGLANRVLLADRLQQAMTRARRHGRSLAVAYLDLDGFKAVNDQHGHEVGDQLLIAIAARLRQTLRETDTIARLGGDEFVAVLSDLDDDPTLLLERLLTAVVEPVRVGGRTLRVSASIGVTFYPQAEAVDADQLLRQADQAMYQAKLAGKNRYHLFNAAQDSAVRGHFESLGRIRQALHAGELVLYYQPKVNMRTGAVVGAEALLRWRHPEQGLLAPGAFLPVVEDHALGVEIGQWVLETAVGQMAAWRDAGVALPVSVNVSARQLQQDDFVARLQALLARYPQVPPGDLELEVLETSALEDIERVSTLMSACAALGVGFALDDFGTGYSSLTYLKRLPAQRLKIDQTFVRGMLDDPDDLLILEGVLGLAAAFGRHVIAEGVETAVHGEMLLLLGCEQAQGYGIARPMPAGELVAWAAQWHAPPGWLGRGPVSRDDLPILTAIVEHRAWTRHLDEYLRDVRDTPPPMDVRQCRFGAWWDAPARRHLRASAIGKTIDGLHQQVHALAATLLTLHAQGHADEARARLGELRASRDALATQLRRIIEPAPRSAEAVV